MRLIDLDKVSINIHASKEVAEEVGRQLVNAPTAEAIPIEWIRKWNTQRSPLVHGIIAYMLFDWEKENDTQI